MHQVQVNYVTKGKESGVHVKKVVNLDKDGKRKTVKSCTAFKVKKVANDQVKNVALKDCKRRKGKIKVKQGGLHGARTQQGQEGDSGLRAQPSREGGQRHGLRAAQENAKKGGATTQRRQAPRSAPTDCRVFGRGRACDHDGPKKRELRRWKEDLDGGCFEKRGH